MGSYGPHTVRTPWGQVQELRERRLRPGHGRERQDVLRNQRERLFAAMVGSVADKGYEATTVADLLELSGVSRSAFYEQFRDKEECFLATYDAIVDGVMELVREQLQAGDSPQVAARRALSSLLAAIAAEPAAARLCFHDAYTAGKSGYAAIERAMDRLAALAGETIAQVNGHGRLPEGMVIGLLGGGQAIIENHLRNGQEETLPDILPILWDWALSYEPPPEPLKLAGRRAKPAQSRYPPFVAHNQAERIIRALAAASAEHGYPAVTIGEIAARASISQATFYSHFADKDAAFAAALDSAVTQMLAAMMPAGRRANDWPNAVRASVGALCDFGAAEPELVCLAARDAYAGGRVTLKIRGRMFSIVRRALAPGFALAPERKPIVADAVIGGALSLFYKRILADGPETLPELGPMITYIVLAPFCGAEHACEVANGDGRGGRESRRSATGAHDGRDRSAATMRGRAEHESAHSQGPQAP